MERLNDFLDEFRFFRFKFIAIWTVISIFFIFIHRILNHSFKTRYIHGKVTSDELREFVEKGKKFFTEKVRIEYKKYEYRVFTLSHNKRKYIQRLHKNLKRIGFELDLVVMGELLSTDLESSESSFDSLWKYIEGVAIVQKPEESWLFR